MKVFLSWSGDTSHKVAIIFRDWLPLVIQSVQPYVSSEDIDKGTRWSSDVAKELETSTYGIICISKDNLTAPWINFEAGALSKTISKTYVCPFLFGLKRSEISSTSPLLQFQSTIYEKEDVKKLILSINSACEDDKLDITRLEKVFEVWWPSLNSQLDEVLKECSKGDTTSKESDKKDINEAILEEILELSRNQHKILSSPEELLPQGYLFHTFKRLGYLPINHGVWDDINVCLDKVLSLLDVMEHSENFELNLSDTIDLLKSITRPMKYLSRFQLEATRLENYDDFYRGRKRVTSRREILLTENNEKSEKTS